MKSPLPVLVALLPPFLGSLSSLAAQTVQWTGNTDPNLSGTWETGANWSAGVPTSSDNAQLLDVTTGTRTVTISSGSPQTIQKLTLTQTTPGAVNELTLEDTLTVQTSGSGTSNFPFAITATAGQDSIVTNIQSGAILYAVNTNSSMNGVSYNGTLNLMDNSTFKLEVQGGASDLLHPTFGGPIHVTGSNAQLLLAADRFVQNPHFNGLVSVTGSGSSLTFNALKGGVAAGVGGSITFDGNDGSGNAVVVGTNSTLNLLPSATSGYVFNHHVLLAAESGGSPGGALTIGVFDGTSGTINVSYADGITLGEGASAIHAKSTVTTALAGTSHMAGGSELIVASDNAQGSFQFSNSGTLTMDAATVTLDWAASGSNNPSNTTIGRRFVNTGTWTAENHSVIQIISTTGRPTSGGYGFGTNNDNSGTLNLKSGSTVDFASLYNTGYLNLGSSTAGVSDATVGIGSPNNTLASSTLINGVSSPTPTSSDSAGHIAILGNVTFGRAAASSTSTLNNGSATSTGSTLQIGDGTTPITFTVQNSTVDISNFAGNHITLAANTTLHLRSSRTDTSTGNTTFTNAGTFVQAGTLDVQSNGWTTPTLNTAAGGTYQLSGTAATINRLPGNGSGGSVFAPTLSIGGLLVGSSTNDRLTYTDTSGRSGNANAILNITLAGGEIAPGNGTAGSGLTSVGNLDFVNSNLTTSGAAKLSFDIGGTSASGLFDSISLTGTFGGIFTLSGDNDTLDIRIVNGFSAIAPQTYQIFTGTSLVGTFDHLLFNGSAVSSEYTILYNPGNIQITLMGMPIPEPSPALLGLGALSLFAWIHRKRA